MSRTNIQTNLRLPADLKEWLMHQAEARRRSFSNEVITRLEMSADYQQHIGEKSVDSHFSRSKDRGKVSPVKVEAAGTNCQPPIENPHSSK